MKIVGITGGIGSGKTTIARYFNERFDIPVYYADTEAKALMQTDLLRSQIINLLGNKAYTNNILDRKYVASKVFKDSKLLEQLNKIVHPAVKVHFEEWSVVQEAPYVLKEAAILFENGTHTSCDFVILVTAPEDVRIQRVLDRDHTSVKEIKNRIDKQWEDSKKIPLADFVIENIDLEISKKKVLEIHHQLLETPLNT
ncbi:dephospho-CoA kinase [Leeuwenhoekiella sp. W20_SRS_FM14]|uniref:dephospho-CoA kinase n=1 Tax=Leeuwenhoekiella sp. W20_SRS_FM14 TaxID=3240270 RepID=UPI003F976557